MTAKEYAANLLGLTENVAPYLSKYNQKVICLFTVGNKIEQCLEIGSEDNDYTPDNDVRFLEKVKLEINIL